MRIFVDSVTAFTLVVELRRGLDREAPEKLTPIETRKVWQVRDASVANVPRAAALARRLQIFAQDLQVRNAPATRSTVRLDEMGPGCSQPTGVSVSKPRLP